MPWTPNKPIAFLPEDIRKLYSEQANCLYYDLLANRLEVILIPAPEPQYSGHMIRSVQNRNPKWYRDLYWSYNHFRRDRSLRALDRIRKQEDRYFKVSPYKYDATYRELIHNILIKGFENNYFPNNKVRTFFGLEKIPEKYLDEVPF